MNCFTLVVLIVGGSVVSTLLDWVSRWRRVQSLFGVRIEVGRWGIDSSTWCKININLALKSPLFAQCRSQGHLLPRLTTSIDSIIFYECLDWMAAEIRDKNFAICSLYRSQDVTTMQRIQSGSFGFSESEIKFIRIKQLRETVHNWFNGRRLSAWCLLVYCRRNNKIHSSNFVKPNLIARMQ